MGLFDLFKKKEVIPDYKTFRTYVAGTKFENRDGTSRQDVVRKIKEGSPIDYRIDQYEDEDCIELYYKKRMIGYMPKDEVPLNARRIRDGKFKGIYASDKFLKDGMVYLDIIVHYIP